MRVAVLFYGVVHRSLPYTGASIVHHLMAPLRKLGAVDVYFHSWDVEHIENVRTGENVLLERCDFNELIPYAKGRYESQVEFDATVDWERFFRNNTLWTRSGYSDRAIKQSLMNYRRAIASLERCWQVMMDLRTARYDGIVVARPDVRYLNDLPCPKVAPGRIWVPGFHPWGGVNDRFALGDEAVMRIYCNRSDFMEKAATERWALNSERVLKRWLERNGIEVRKLDFVFQRIRTDGRVAQIDAHLWATIHRLAPEESALPSRRAEAVAAARLPKDLRR